MCGISYIQTVTSSKFTYSLTDTPWSSATILTIWSAILYPDTLWSTTLQGMYKLALHPYTKAAISHLLWTLFVLRSCPWQEERVLVFDTKYYIIIMAPLKNTRNLNFYHKLLKFFVNNISDFLLGGREGGGRNIIREKLIVLHCTQGVKCYLQCGART